MQLPSSASLPTDRWSTGELMLFRWWCFESWCMVVSFIHHCPMSCRCLWPSLLAGCSAHCWVSVPGGEHEGPKQVFKLDKNNYIWIWQILCLCVFVTVVLAACLTFTAGKSFKLLLAKLSLLAWLATECCIFGDDFGGTVSWVPFMAAVLITAALQPELGNIEVSLTYCLSLFVAKISTCPGSSPTSTALSANGWLNMCSSVCDNGLSNCGRRSWCVRPGHIPELVKLFGFFTTKCIEAVLLNF